MNIRNLLNRCLELLLCLICASCATSGPSLRELDGQAKNLMAQGRLEEAEVSLRRSLSIVERGTYKESFLLVDLADVQQGLGKVEESRATLLRCISGSKQNSSDQNICKVRLERLNSGNVKSRGDVTADARVLKRIRAEVDAEVDDDTPKQPAISPGMAALAGIAQGLNNVSRGGMPTMPMPYSNQQQALRSGHVDTTPTSQNANHCISIHPDPGSPSPQFHNTCNQTVWVAWCSESTKSFNTCKAGMNGEALTNITPGNSWPTGPGLIHYAACAGKSGARMTNGRTFCE